MLVLWMWRTFGRKLIQLGTPIWKIQADALGKTDYAGDVGGSFVVARKEDMSMQKDT